MRRKKARIYRRVLIKSDFGNLMQWLCHNKKTVVQKTTVNELGILFIPIGNYQQVILLIL